MNPDPVPPVRPLLTHVIADEPLRREAGISVQTWSSPGSWLRHCHWQGFPQLGSIHLSTSGSSIKGPGFDSAFPLSADCSGLRRSHWGSRWRTGERCWLDWDTTSASILLLPLHGTFSQGSPPHEVVEKMVRKMKSMDTLAPGTLPAH